MPIIGLGFHVVLALFCAVHAVRNGQPLYWLFILFAFPMLGSLVYIFAIWLPGSRLQRNAMRAVSNAAKALDPSRELREATAAFDEAPTAQNQMRLAAALLDLGRAEEAAQQYQACLNGPFASDPDIRFGAARSFVECQRYADALSHLQKLRSDRPEYRAEAVALLTARSLAGVQRSADARHEFESAVARFGTFEAQAEFAIWAYQTGDAALAADLQQKLDKLTAKWTTLTRELNEPVLRRLRAAQQLAQKNRA